MLRDLKLAFFVFPYSRAARRIVTFFRRHRASQLKKVRPAEYMNVGCGERPVPGFINVDKVWFPGVDVVWDVTRPFPWPERSLKGIFTEHCIEHIPYEKNKAVLAAFYRWLKPGGVLRVVVPDCGLYIAKYVESKTQKVCWPEEQPDEEFTPLTVMSRVFMDHGHRTAFDYETIERMLIKTGFRQVRRRAFGEGADAAIVADSPSRQAESLYVEAVKP